jgi:uncharacterized membrane protein
MAPRRRVLGAGLLTGIGIAATLDQVVLHLLLGWHHLYDRGSEQLGRISDGLFHLAGSACLAVGIVGLVRHGRGRERRALGAVLAGAGGFNLYDGTVQHKVLRLHQVRPEAADPLPYDVAFIGLAVVVLVAGLALLRERPGARRAAPVDAP